MDGRSRSCLQALSFEILLHPTKIDLREKSHQKGKETLEGNTSD
jgi:hypothetical protein